MTRSALRLVIALALLLPIAPAADATRASDYYGWTSRAVAKHIGCKNFRGKGGGAFHKDSGACWIRGKRVSVITFRGSGQQASWNAAVTDFFPADFYWANGKGAVVVARNGNRPAARLGARRLPGVVRHG